ncbi:FMRFamide receptor [Orchesella cincta]|uniref:FMRFamide receptor n=1 Tax=Orchesella cincta TaxID=48709 RepID=A0A1D2ME42_ORCCI|nr:FMRFamide receptor [Orchesella cincta]
MSRNSSIEKLDYWSCIFLSSESHVFTLDNQSIFEYNCRVHGSYLTSSDTSSGFAVSLFISVLIFTMGAFGVVTNILNILILRKSGSQNGVRFRESEIYLAMIELVLCLFTILLMLMMILILANWTRTKEAFILLLVIDRIFMMSCTAAFYQSIVVSVERILMVVFPIKAKLLLERSMGRRLAVFVLVLALSPVLNLSWILKAYVGENEVFDWDTDSEMATFPFVVKRNSYYSNVWPRWLQDLLVGFKSLGPFPTFLILRGLLYLTINNANKQSGFITKRQKRDIHAAKMFSVIVMILLACNVTPFVLYITYCFRMEIYWELVLLHMLSDVTGAATNFIVYFAFGRAFRKEFWNLMRKIGSPFPNTSTEITSSPSS